MRPPISLAGCLLALLVVGCAERALGPGDVSGAYGLLRYDSDTLPRTYTTGTGCWARVEYGSLVLDDDGTFTLQIVRDEACTNGPLSWANVDASGTYGEVRAPWLGLHDAATGASYLAWLRGTHVVVMVPQVPLIGDGAVSVEFSAEAAKNPNVTVLEPGCCIQPPPPDTSTVVVIIPRP
jgi:hypothetical protein